MMFQCHLFARRMMEHNYKLPLRDWWEWRQIHTLHVELNLLMHPIPTWNLFNHAIHRRTHVSTSSPCFRLPHYSSTHGLYEFFFCDVTVAPRAKCFYSPSPLGKATAFIGTCSKMSAVSLTCITSRHHKSIRVNRTTQVIEDSTPRGRYHQTPHIKFTYTDAHMFCILDKVACSACSR